ncbi:MAG: Ribosomal protein L11 methyltransferase [Syntrophorhabdus sp. PtaB.Bin184]|nr:MAG: Ribosomal protein L11 methyltransferase [Syntrophorhabdus sp. PtaB.Bin184]
MKGGAEKTVKRVDVEVDEGAQELLPEEVYTLHSPSGIWVVEEDGKTVVRAYPAEVETFLAAMRQSGIRIGRVRVIEEPRRDYSEMAKRYFRPVTVEDIVIRAPWNGKRRDVTYITIEPGMAFGTGRHESTRLMMKLMRQTDLTGKRVLDLGCGSALLSLYARVKGARRVYAVDNDLDAVLSAQKNVLLNGAAGIEVVCADLMDVSGRYDIVLANLDIRTFALSSGHIMGLMKKKGTLIVSGIIGREKKEALRLFVPWEPVMEVRKNAWRGFVLRR